MTEAAKPAAKPAEKPETEVTDVRAHAVAEMEKVEAEEPTPSQAELDKKKLSLAKAGGYRTRQDVSK